MDDQAYFEPGFDPSTLSMARLRYFLVTYGVPYPTSAKKGVLVDVFKRYISSKAPQHRASTVDDGQKVAGNTEDEADQSNFSNENVFQSGYVRQPSPPVQRRNWTEKVEASAKVFPKMQVRPRRRKSGSSAAKKAPWAIAISTLLGFAAVWRHEKLEVGYCGIGRPATGLAGVQIPDWAEFIQPQCEPCPPHALCGDRLETECEQDFVYTPHLVSLGGLVPLPPTCEPDSAKARKVDIVKKRALDELRELNARFECGDAPTPDIKEGDLKQTLGTKRRKGMTNEEFGELWTIALGELKNAEEVVSGADGSGHFTLRSTYLASLPLACAIRRSLRETLRECFWQLVTVASIFSGVIYTRHSIASARATEEKANQLAGLALGKLSQQAALHRWNPDMYREDYISVAHLRDDILREDWSATRRKKVWEKVQTKVEKNSNVRSMVKEGRAGDVGRVWEWVGAVEMIGNGSSPPGSSGCEFKKSGIKPRDQLDFNGMQRWDEQGKYY
ncbi:hypothetical protein M433DRAFT_8543 [Acidomyces richmondensis BFW]|nr:hypothetical protein M433DRAFT_8543 [Acidomyces richmondensis BFW]